MPARPGFGTPAGGGSGIPRTPAAGPGKKGLVHVVPSPAGDGMSRTRTPDRPHATGVRAFRDHRGGAPTHDAPAGARSRGGGVDVRGRPRADAAGLPGVLSPRCR